MVVLVDDYIACWNTQYTLSNVKVVTKSRLKVLNMTVIYPWSNPTWHPVLSHLSWLHCAIHSLMVEWNVSLLTWGSWQSGSSSRRRAANLSCSGLSAVMVCRYCAMVEADTSPEVERATQEQWFTVHTIVWICFVEHKPVYLCWTYYMHYTWCQGVHVQRIHLCLYCPQALPSSHSRVTPTLNMKRCMHVEEKVNILNICIYIRFILW